jgi:CBS domain-containing protein
MTAENERISLRAEAADMMQEPDLKMFLFFSELQGRAVIDSEGRTVGKLADLKVRLGELFPRVTTLIVKKRRGKKLAALNWNDVESLNGSLVSLKPGAESRFTPLEVGNEEILLREDLLDKQVVDTFGAKIERVNDVHLLIVNRDLRIVHVDFGVRGILRRLGWLRTIDRFTNWLFAYSLPDKIISWKYVQPLASDPKKNLKLNVTTRKLQELHPSDIADIIEELDKANRSSVFKMLDLETAADTLQEVDPKLHLSLLETTPEEMISDILEEMEPDEATDILADLPEEKKQRLIRTMEKPYRQTVEELLKFEEGTAGSIMTKDFIALRRDTTIGAAVEEFKKTTHPLETVAYLYITDEEQHPLGVITLRHLLLCDRQEVLGKLMNPHLIKVDCDDDLETVAELFAKYKFIELPVVDKENALQGIITLQDIVKANPEEL